MCHIVINLLTQRGVCTGPSVRNTFPSENWLQLCMGQQALLITEKWTSFSRTLHMTTASSSLGSETAMMVNCLSRSILEAVFFTASFSHFLSLFPVCSYNFLCDEIMKWYTNKPVMWYCHDSPMTSHRNIMVLCDLQYLPWYLYGMPI